MDIVGRDLILPLGFVGLIVVGLAIRHLVGSDRPEGQLMVAFLVVGGVLSSVGDLLFLSDVTYWRSGGWSGHPPEIMESIGRAASAIETLNVWPEVAGFPILAAGLLYVGRLCRTRPELPTQLGIVAYVEAALLTCHRDCRGGRKRYGEPGAQPDHGCPRRSGPRGVAGQALRSTGQALKRMTAP